MRWFLFVFIITLIAFAAVNSSDDPDYGLIAGAVYPPVDAANLTGYIILTPMMELDGDTAYRVDESESPIYIRRMFKGQFLVDSIPAGHYRTAINGVAYDSSYKVIARCIEQVLVDFRVASDSVSILAVRLDINRDEERHSRKYSWTEQIRPDTLSTVRIKGMYNDVSVFEVYNDLTLPREGYMFDFIPNLKDSSTVNGLNLTLFSNHFYHGRENELRLSYNIARDTVLIEIEPVMHEDTSTAYRYRQPLFEMINMPLNSSVNYMKFIAGESSLYEVEIDSLAVNLEAVEENSVQYYRRPVYMSIEE